MEPPKPKWVLLSELASSGITTIPSNYVRPISDRPNLHHLQSTSRHHATSIPVIDLGDLVVDAPCRANVIKEIAHACQNYGFFQVKNHGVSEEVIEKVMKVAREFFRLPESERLKNYTDDPTKATRLSTSFNVRTEKVSSWRDFLRLHCYPIQDYIHQWPSNPPSFRDDVAEYSKGVRELAVRLLGAISESLGLEREYMEKAMGKQAQHMALNYYPPCPQPELTYGLPAHADPNAITILLQDHVSGLNVLHHGEWIAVNPIPNTFIINIGDQIQALSNGWYKSVLHRALVNCREERISIPTFYAPSPDAMIAPAPLLVDEEHPPLYRSFSYGEYYNKFWDRGLQRETVTVTVTAKGLNPLVALHAWITDQIYMYTHAAPAIETQYCPQVSEKNHKSNTKPYNMQMKAKIISNTDVA